VSVLNVCYLAALPQCWTAQPVLMSSAMAGWSRVIIHFEPEETQMIKTIVIGAGEMGASVAYRLAQAGAAVTVLEATRIGGGNRSKAVSPVNGFPRPPSCRSNVNIPA
jgi:heterodisulfide reductase subunit A-like polyferredoxin